jgi:hypothetical protein
MLFGHGHLPHIQGLLLIGTVSPAAMAWTALPFCDDQHLSTDRHEVQLADIGLELSRGSAAPQEGAVRHRRT